MATQSSKAKKSFGKDFTASIVVFLVALPLSMGIALASGAPIKAGLIAAVVGGVLVGLTGGAPLQVSGPAAGLSVMVYALIQHFGFESLRVIGMLAGLIQLALGVVGAAQLTLIISPAVIHAMLAGIGIMIALGQFHVLLGVGPKSSAINNILALPQSFASLNVGAFIVGITTLAVIVLWNQFLAKKIKFLPGSLLAVIVGTLISLILPWDMPRVHLDAQLFSLPTMPQLGDFGFLALFQGALGLALVASAESLLCAVATDKLHNGARADLNKELRGQGIANFFSGVFGGLPVTGVIVRSSANIAAGAVSRVSAILHGVWVLIFVSFCSVFLSKIPLAVLAGLLVHVGVKLVKIQEFKELKKFRETIVYLSTLLGVVFINLLAGIGIGFGFAIFFLLLRMSRVNVVSKTKENGDVDITLKGSLSFVAVPRLLAQLKQIPAAKTVRMKFDVDVIDHAAVDAIRTWEASYGRMGGKVEKENLDTLWRSLAAPLKA